MGRSHYIGIIYLIGVAAQAGDSPPAACDAAMTAARGVRGDRAALEAAFSEASKHCPAEAAARVGDALAFALFNAARAAEGEARRALLERAASLTRDWRVHATLGSDRLEAGDRAGAVAAFDVALLDLQEGPRAEAPPETVRAILTMSNNARATAGAYVPMPRTRSGAPGGAAAARVGGVTIEATPFPIEFVFGEATPTEDGELAIEDLAGLLASAEVASLTLAGHTDPIGPDAANEALSLRRAEAVRTRLAEAGVREAGSIRIAGCGEGSPPAIEGAHLYDEAELHQIMRRVELVRAGPACPR